MGSRFGAQGELPEQFARSDVASPFNAEIPLRTTRAGVASSRGRFGASVLRSSMLRQMLNDARQAVALMYGRVEREPSGEIAGAFAAWFDDFEKLHGPLERRRLVDRTELSRAYGLDGADVDLPLLLWAIDVVSAVVLRQLAWHATANRANQPASRTEVLFGDLTAQTCCVGLESPIAIQPVVGTFSPELWEAIDDLTASLVEAKATDPFCDAYRPLFHGLVPKRTRHALGAFFTPRWLADWTIKSGMWTPTMRTVDPACGSGVFLLELCRRLDGEVRHGRLEASDALTRIAESIAGQEINGLSAFAARVNLLWAVSAISQHADETPPLALPRVVTDDVLLDQAALLSDGRFDLVVGNPPWVNWEHLPPDYRDSTAHLWPPLGLFDHRGRDKAWSKEDVSVLFAYLSLSKLARDNGVLAFLIPASLFKSSMNARGFRRFRLGQDGHQLEVIGVEEFDGVNAFDGAVGKPALTVIRLGRPTQYPVDYRITRPIADRRFDPSSSAEIAEEGLESESRVAMPSTSDDHQSPWMTLTPSGHSAIQSVLGTNSYRARTGFFTGGANGVFYLDVLGDENGLLRVKNVTARARRPVRECELLIEPRFVFPLLQGREVSDWASAPALHVLCPHTADTAMKPVDPVEMAALAPATHEYLSSHAEVLAERRGFVGWERNLLQHGFYACQRVGPYTFADYKVVWRYIAKRFTCCVVGPKEVAGEAKPVIPNEKVMLIGCVSADEAYFVCGVLSATSVRTAIDSRIIGTQISPSVISNIAVPPFRAEHASHTAIANLCRQGHVDGALSKVQADLDDVVDQALRFHDVQDDQLALAVA